MPAEPKTFIVAHTCLAQHANRAFIPLRILMLLYLQVAQAPRSLGRLVVEALLLIHRQWRAGRGRTLVRLAAASRLLLLTAAVLLLAAHGGGEGALLLLPTGLAL